MEINPLSVVSVTIIFSHSEGCLFTLLRVSFVVQKLLNLTRSHLFIFAFISNILGGGSWWHKELTVGFPYGSVVKNPLAEQETQVTLV